MLHDQLSVQSTRRDSHTVAAWLGAARKRYGKKGGWKKGSRTSFLLTSSVHLCCNGNSWSFCYYYLKSWFHLLLPLLEPSTAFLLPQEEIIAFLLTSTSASLPFRALLQQSSSSSLLLHAAGIVLLGAIGQTTTVGWEEDKDGQVHDRVKRNWSDVVLAGNCSKNMILLVGHPCNKRLLHALEVMCMQ